MIENLFLSVGAMKAGTTWLYEQFKNHPDIGTVPEKEIHYFASVTGKWNLLGHEDRINKFFINTDGKKFDEFKNTLDGICWYAEYAKPKYINDAWYQNLFRETKKKYCADFCNLNSSLDENGWRRVRQNFTGRLKVIYCMRDPFKRVWSHYKFHMEWIGRGNYILSDGLTGFKSLLNEDWFIDIVRYDLALEKMQSNLRDDEFSLFYFEDFRTDPQASIDNICDFLEISKIDKNESEFDIKVNPSQDIKIPDDYAEYLWEYLIPTYEALDKKKLTHNSWIRKL